MTVDLPIDAHIPESYIEHERLRLEAYRKIADAGDVPTLSSVREELTDRYGPLPDVVENLLAVATLRIELRAHGIHDVINQGTYVRFSPVELPDSAAMRVGRLYPGTHIKPAVRQVLIPAPKTSRVGGSNVEGLPVLEWVRGVCSAMWPD
jgi:transcription-repair coupling factor (superfamily II helicase)